MDCPAVRASGTELRLCSDGVGSAVHGLEKHHTKCHFLRVSVYLGDDVCWTGSCLARRAWNMVETRHAWPGGPSPVRVKGPWQRDQTRAELVWAAFSAHTCMSQRLPRPRSACITSSLLDSLHSTASAGAAVSIAFQRPGDDQHICSVMAGQDRVGNWPCLSVHTDLS